MRALMAMAVVTALVIGIGLGAEYQRYFDYNRFVALINLPEGALTYTENPPLIWQKTANRVLAYQPIPTRDDIRISHDFGVPFTPPPVTTTTVPKKEKRR